MVTSQCEVSSVLTLIMFSYTEHYRQSLFVQLQVMALCLCEHARAIAHRALGALGLTLQQCVSCAPVLAHFNPYELLSTTNTYFLILLKAMSLSTVCYHFTFFSN